MGRKTNRASNLSADAKVRAYLASLGNPDGKAGQILEDLRAEPPWTDDPDSWDARLLPEESLAWLGGLAARQILAGGAWPPEALARARERGDRQRNTLAHVLATYGLLPPPGLEDARNASGQAPVHLAVRFGAVPDPGTMDLEDGFGTTVRYYALTNGSWKPGKPEDFDAPLDRGRGFFEVLLPLLARLVGSVGSPPLALMSYLESSPLGFQADVLETMDDDAVLGVLLPLVERAALTPDAVRGRKHDDLFNRRAAAETIRGLSMGLLLRLAGARTDRKDFLRRLQRNMGKPSVMIRAAGDWVDLWRTSRSREEDGSLPAGILPDETDCRALADCLIFAGGRRSTKILETLRRNGDPFSASVLDRFAYLSLRRAAETARSTDREAEINL